MSKSTRRLTLSALFSALAVVSLYVASVWPTGQLGLTAVASLFVAAAVIESGIASGISVFAVSSLIAFLILPNRIPLVLFVVFFGYYPVIKSLIEKRGHIILQFLCKLAVFNASLSVTWFFLRGLLFDFGEAETEILFVSGGSGIEVFFIFLSGSLVFILFDYGFTKLVWFYINRISKQIGSSFL